MSYINFNEKSVNLDALKLLSKEQLLDLKKTFTAEFNAWKEDLGISISSNGRSVLISSDKISKEDLLETLRWAMRDPIDAVRNLLFRMSEQDFKEVRSALKNAGFRFEIYKTAKAKSKTPNPLLASLVSECRESYIFNVRSIFSVENYYSAVETMYRVLNIELTEEAKAQSEKKLTETASQKFALLVKEIQKFSPTEEDALEIISKSNGSNEKLELALRELFANSLKGQTVSCTREPGDLECTGNYIVGEYRCECGSRRCGIDVDLIYTTNEDRKVSGIEYYTSTSAY